MNKLRSLFLALSTVAALGTAMPAHAIELERPGPGPGAIALPGGGRCPDLTPNAKKDWTLAGTEKEVLGKMFNMGIDGHLKFTVDCKHADVTGSIALSGQLASFEVKPLEVKLIGSTDETNKSALTLEFVTFGKKIGGTTIADTTSPIHFVESLDLDPVPTKARSGSWDSSEPDFHGLEFEAHAEYEVTAVGGAWLSAHITPTRFEVNVLATATIGASASAWASGPLVETEGTGVLNVVKFIGVAYARLKPQSVGNGVTHWVATAELSEQVDYLLSGKLKMTIDYLLDTYDYVVFKYSGQNIPTDSLEFSQDLGVDKPF